MRKRQITAVLAVATSAIVSATIALALPSKPSYPLHTLPPSGWGVTNPDITQATISQTICNKGNWSTKLIRPGATYTTALKIQQLKDMGYTDTNTADFEEDHLISLVLGGNPTDPRNLWPQPYTNPVGSENLGAKEKDTVEVYLAQQVCTGAMTLQEAQDAIKTDWVKVYHSMLKQMQGSLGVLGAIIATGIDQDDN